MSIVFCCLVPAVALSSLSPWTAAYQVPTDLAAGVAVVASEEADDGSVVELSEWEYTNCCCVAGSIPMSGLGNWTYNGGPNVWANGSRRERSAMARPCINIYIINVGGHHKAFGSRRLANHYGKRMKSIRFNGGPRNNRGEGSRFESRIALRAPGAGRKSSGAFDIQNLFASLQPRFGFDLQNLFAEMIARQGGGEGSAVVRALRSEQDREVANRGDDSHQYFIDYDPSRYGKRKRRD